MSRDAIKPVCPVDPVGAIRVVTKGNTYFRHLDQWRMYSEVFAAERRARLARIERQQQKAKK